MLLEESTMEVHAVTRIGVLILLSVLPGAADRQAEIHARKVMDDFMIAFNSRDTRAWAATLNYPHVRLASNTVRVYATADEYIRDNAIENRDAPGLPRERTWHHSAWESITVIQSSPEKVHLAVVFVRYDASNKEISRFASLYVVTLQNGHWGVQARSSFAP